MKQKYFIYMDKHVISDVATLGFVMEMAEKHRPIHLYLHDIWELEEVKQVEAYGYVCDVLYGSDMEQSVIAYAKQHKQKLKQVIVLHGDEECKRMSIDAICINYDGNVNMQHYQNVCAQQMRRRAIGVYAVLGLSIVYFIIYFLLLDRMPLFMIEGNVAMLFALIPVIICSSAIGYGLYSEVLHWSVVLDLLDLV